MDIHFPNVRTAFLLKCWVRAVQKNADLLDLEKMLNNAPILAVAGVDTAENEPLEVWM